MTTPTHEPIFGEGALQLVVGVALIGVIVLVLAYWQAIAGFIAGVVIGGFILATCVAAIVAIWKAALRR